MRALNLSGGKNIYFFSLTKDFFVYLKKMLSFTFCQENKSKSRSPVKIITHFFMSPHTYIYIKVQAMLMTIMTF